MTTAKDKQTLSPPVEVAVPMWEILPHHLDKLPTDFQLLAVVPTKYVGVQYCIVDVHFLLRIFDVLDSSKALLSFDDPTEYFTEEGYGSE